MSRTRKDKPWRLIDKDHYGYPPPFAGAWSGIKSACRVWWRADRHKTREALRKGEEPITRPRNSEKWNWY